MEILISVIFLNFKSLKDHIILNFIFFLFPLREIIMEIKRLKNEINEKVILLNPKLFINKYFDDIINQLDIRTTKYEIKEQEKSSKRFKLNNKDSIDSKAKSSENVDRINDWRQLIVDELKQAEFNIKTFD